MGGCLLCLLADHLASVWRQAKLQEFEQRLVALGYSKDGQALSLLQKLHCETVALNDLQETQQQQVLPFKDLA